MSQGASRPCRVTVCRGCCCGSARKHPDVDHEQQVSSLDDHLPGRIRVVTECLGPCEQANVVVVQPSKEGRASGGRPAWLGGIMADEHVASLVRWVLDGGPGVVPIPSGLATRRIPRPTR